jgi:hypothetical protein
MTEEDAMNQESGFEGFSSFFDDIFKGGMSFNFMDDDDDMEDFMENLSKHQFKDMFKDLGKGYRASGFRQKAPKGRAANAKSGKGLASSGLKKSD